MIPFQLVAPRNDIAIYSPFAFTFYEEGAGKIRGGGGAELQTTLLARKLAGKGLRVAHIVYPIEIPAPQPLPSLEVVQLPFYRRRRGLIGRLTGAVAIWRSLATADARLYVFRTGLSGGIAAFTIGAAFCLLRRKLLVFSASNDLDFIFDRDDRPGWLEAVYRFALQRTCCIVVQTDRQLELARRAVGNHGRVMLIPSFAEPAERSDHTAESEPFLWASRVVDYKLPLQYVELARAVPEARFRMIAAQTGETPPDLAASVAEAAEELGNLELLPNKPREVVLELIARSSAVVLTSRHEGVPNVFLEAWARGVPVISLHFDPDGRISEQGLGICAEGSWERFVDATRELWNDAALRKEIGERARRYVAKVHSATVVGDRWATLLRNALGYE